MFDSNDSKTNKNMTGNGGRFRPAFIVPVIMVLLTVIFFIGRNYAYHKTAAETTAAAAAETFQKEIEIPEKIAWTEKDYQAYEKFSAEEKEIYDKCAEEEPVITEDLVHLVTSFGGGMAGLEYRLKLPSSAYEKAHERPGDQTDMAFMKDIIRYTEIDDSKVLIDHLRGILKGLEDKGYTVVQIKNTWNDPDNSYKGINTFIRSREGRVFELQFHTPESFEAKNGEMHRLYEEARVLREGSPERIALEDKMFQISDRLERPDKAEELESFKGGV